MQTKFDIYSEVTQKIISALEAGVCPWKCPFKSLASGLPMNLVSRREYQGVNLLMLGLTRYESPYWLTAKQTFQAGGRIKKGEKASMVVFWKPVEYKNPDENGDMTVRPILRYYNVFNIAQTENVEHLIPGLTKPVELQPNEACEKIVQEYVNAGGPRIQYGHKGAAYSPSKDVIEMPSKEAFKSAEEMNAVLFHELAHSSGSEGRLNRKTLTNNSMKTAYSMEELVAEISSCFLAMKAGIQPDIQNSASYIDGWLRVFRGDKRMIVIASAMAQKAVNYILGERKENHEEEKSFLKVA